MRRMLARMLIGTLVVVAVWIAAGAAMVAVAGTFKPSGTYVDIGGRKLRLVCAGPAAGQTPTVWMEAGAFGLAADFAAIQEKLTAKGIRSCAYDRAGMGWSDPGPKPRDSEAIVSDLEKLIAASGERGPFILMGHSMAGLHTRLFAGRNPDKVAGLVLIEATTPEQIDSPNTTKFLTAFTGISRVAAVSASLDHAAALLDRRGADRPAATGQRREAPRLCFGPSCADGLRRGRDLAEERGGGAPRAALRSQVARGGDRR